MTVVQCFFDSIDDIIRANQDAGYHFFEKSARRFFDSHVGQTVYGGRYFVTSEQFRPLIGHPHPRLYTVRRTCADGHIETVGEFQQHASREAAIREIKRLLKEEES